MSTMDYDDLLNMTWDGIPEPQLLPDGGWLLTAKNAAFVKSKEADKSHKILYSYSAKAPVAVAEDLLDELGEYDITINDLVYTQYIENAADWDKVRKFVALHGVEMEGALFDSNGKLAFNKKFRGTEVVATVGQRSYDNDAGETIWQNTLSKFQKVTE